MIALFGMDAQSKMVRRAFALALLLAVLHGCCAAGVLVSGRVVLPAGAGTVRLVLNGGQQETIARANGQFEFHNVPEGEIVCIKPASATEHVGSKPEMRKARL